MEFQSHEPAMIGSSQPVPGSRALRVILLSSFQNSYQASMIAARRFFTWGNDVLLYENVEDDLVGRTTRQRSGP